VKRNFSVVSIDDFKPSQAKFEPNFEFELSLIQLSLKLSIENFFLSSAWLNSIHIELSQV
jgi:hypothetical protein